MCYPKRDLITPVRELRLVPAEEAGIFGCADFAEVVSDLRQFYTGPVLQGASFRHAKRALHNAKEP